MKFNETKLKSGLKVITVPMTDNPAVTVLVMVETGSKYEKKETNGLSHFLEHMVFKGTPKRPKAIDISKELESVGAQFNAFTGQEYTGYYAKVNPEHLDTALDVVSDIYLNPLLDQAEISKEKGVIVEELRMYKDLPHRHVHNLFTALVHGDQPAGWDIIGTEENINNFKQEDFKKYIAEHYVAESTLVIVSGSFDEKTILEKIENYFSNISTSKKSEKVAVKEAQTKPELLVQFKESDQAHLVMGVRSFSARSEYETVLSVLATILGKGMSSRLWQKLREEMGVGYYVQASSDTLTDHGLFTISAGVDIKRIEEVISTLITECKKIITDPISDEELKKVKNYMCGSFMLGLETSDARAEYVAGSSIVKGQIESPQEEIDKIQKVTVKEIKDIAQKIFVDEGLNLAIIGPYKDKAQFEKILTFK
jgi:predicted Zn-dependent peptidase